MSDNIPNPLKNFTPRANPQKLEQNTQINDKSPLDLAGIDTMDVEELRDLCKRMACQYGLIARMTQDETAQAMLDTLAETALKPIVRGLNMKADIQNRMSAIDRWLDRTKGKPAQSLQLDANVNHVIVNATIRFTDELLEAENKQCTIIEHVDNS